MRLASFMMDACATVRDAGGSAGDVMRAMGNALLNGQEICVQHAAYVCTGLPFRGSSRETVCIPSAAPTDRAFLVKQDWELKRLPSDSTDCIAFSLVDNGVCRTSNPQLHELGADDVCLADFAALFSPVQHRQADNENDDADVLEGSELKSNLEQFCGGRTCEFINLLIIFGDFNINLLQPSNASRQECSFFSTRLLRQCAEYHTTDYGSLLDHV
jgi:hypothetical protein